MTATYLDAILDHHRAAATSDTRTVDELMTAALDMPPTRGFRDALAESTRIGVISEIKRRSPSKGDLHPDLDPVEMASTYQRGGASCLSVLTDTMHFGGSVSDLQMARQACELPVLRKDFTVSALNVMDARLIGADCVLLIAAALDRSELVDFHQLASEVGLDVLVEIHDEDELEHALDADASLVGVNQRDLVTFRVDHERAERMARLIPDTAVKVAESGIRSRDDARRLEDAGYDAVLVGEMLVTSSDPAAAIADLVGGR